MLLRQLMTLSQHIRQHVLFQDFLLSTYKSYTNNSYGLSGAATFPKAYHLVYSVEPSPICCTGIIKLFMGRRINRILCTNLYTKLRCRIQLERLLKWMWLDQLYRLDSYYNFHLLTRDLICTWNLGELNYLRSHQQNISVLLWVH